MTGSMVQLQTLADRTVCMLVLREAKVAIHEQMLQPWVVLF